nr:3129_t:CDS:2 [Entrophospora candida]
MNTGEGKTLTAFLPICLNALSGRTKPILDFFQISSGVNLTNISSEEKQRLYNDCSVIYTTGSELGFDYLRNNLVTSVQEKRLQDYYYAIIDEVDSLLLDEGMNPLIISQRAYGGSVINPAEYQLATKIVNSLKEKKDYKVDQKEKEVWFTKLGIKKCEEFYQTDNLFSFKNHRQNFLLHNALKTKHLYHKDIDYIVDRERERIVLIDALTGRLVPNRVYSSGIHQAIESKENLPVSTKSKTIATITYQNFFRLFDKLSGMTGTAKSEAEEFHKESKYKAIIKLIKKNNQTTKRPILIGSPSVETSEYLSLLLVKAKIFHYKLNAVNHQQEAEIVSQAGKLGSITISTNMAGRGTDIVLSKESREAGGLLVIGVERNTSRRIDNQLRGRSGRQGDPGESQFYVSLEDELIKNFEIKEKISSSLKAKRKGGYTRPPALIVNERGQVVSDFNVRNAKKYDGPAYEEVEKNDFNHEAFSVESPLLQEICKEALKIYYPIYLATDFSSDYPGEKVPVPDLGAIDAETFNFIGGESNNYNSTSDSEHSHIEPAVPFNYLSGIGYNNY